MYFYTGHLLFENERVFIMKFKKLVKTAVALGLMSTMLFGCSSKKSETGGSETQSAAQSGDTEEKKVLKVGMECAYPPFNWTQSDKTVANGEEAVPIFGTNDYAYGYDIMLAKQLADTIGYELEVHKVDWSSIVLGMNSGDYDVIIAGMGYTAEREAAVDFTAPYYIRDNVIVVRKDSELANATSLADFTGLKGTTQLGTIWEKYVPQIPEVNQQTYFETTSEVIMAVSTGACDFGVLDEPTAMSAAIANPDITYVKLSGDAGFTVPEGQSLNVCIAVKEGDTELQTLLDNALTEIGWNEEKMVETMSEAVKLQPLSE